MTAPLEAFATPLPAWPSGGAAPDEAAPDETAPAEAERATAGSGVRAAGAPGEPAGVAAAEEATAPRRSIEQIERLLDEVEAALGRLDAGTYGTCTECGAGLDDNRLAASPVVSRCTACAADAAEV